jgi:hypothetical protein
MDSAIIKLNFPMLKVPLPELIYPNALSCNQRIHIPHNKDKCYPDNRFWVLGTGFWDHKRCQFCWRAALISMGSIKGKS